MNGLNYVLYCTILSITKNHTVHRFYVYMYRKYNSSRILYIANTINAVWDSVIKFVLNRHCITNK